MSKEKKEVKEDVKKEVLFLDDLKAQVAASQQNIQKLQQQANQVANSLQQEIGILNHAQHLLNRYELPAKPKEEPKKEATPLEVK